MSGVTRPGTVAIPVIDPARDAVQGDHAPADPAALAASWLPAAEAERMTMALATVGPDGRPRSRTVLLSEFDGERFFFHTDARSRKVAELAADPRVSLTLLWPGTTRQLVVEGVAERAAVTEESRAYVARSSYLRQLAWQNTSSFATLPLAERTARWNRMREGLPPPAPPAEWVGYGVVPQRLIFWVSNPDAASRRLEYVRSDRGWERGHLPG